MGFANLHALGNRGLFQLFARFKIMLYFAEYPVVTDGRTAYRHSVHAIFQSPVCCFLWRIDITIAKNGDFYPRIFFDLPDQGPVGLALIHLRTRATMDGERLDAHIL